MSFHHRHGAISPTASWVGVVASKTPERAERAGHFCFFFIRQITINSSTVGILECGNKSKEKDSNKIELERIQELFLLRKRLGCPFLRRDTARWRCVTLFHLCRFREDV